MRNLILTDPRSRINDFWIRSAGIDGTAVLTSHRDSRLSGRPNDPRYRFQADFYEQFACDIVSETVLDYPYAYISEKTLRPIACKRMFIVLGAAGTLSLLQDRGFETFNDFVDESYDQIKDPQERFLAVISQAEKICSTPLPVLRSYLHDIRDRLNRNFVCLQNLQQKELMHFSKLINNDLL